jgi:hypothetical protein
MLEGRGVDAYLRIVLVDACGEGRAHPRDSGALQQAESAPCGNVRETCWG